jgi:sugar phosphate isomerase/epimerase
VEFSFFGDRIVSNSTSLSRRDFLARSAALTAGAAAAPWLIDSANAQEAGNDAWQIGCYTRPFAKFEFGEALDGIAEAGFASAGLMSIRLPTGSVGLHDVSEEQAAEIGDMVEKRGLKTVSNYYGGPPVAESLEAGIAATRKLIDNCRAARCASILLGGTSRQELFDNYYKAIAECCDYAAERGVSIVLKPHGGLNATGPQCRKIVELVGHENFTIWYDPGNIFYYSEGELDPVDDVTTVDGLVTGMSVKDYRHPREVAINPGSGQVDFPKLLSRLRQGGFTRGPLVVETLAPGDLPATVANARKARRFLEKIVEAIS